MKKHDLIYWNFLSVWNACNLRCQFCYNDYERDLEQFFFDEKEIFKWALKIKKSKNSLVLVWWEPFLHPKINRILLFIKYLNLKYLRIVTNWIKLSDINFAKSLYEYNVTSIEISIHSNNGSIEKKVTKRPGENFLLREKWVLNIVYLNTKFDNKITLYSNTVINYHNYKNIVEIIRYIYNLWIKNINISFMYDLKGLSYDNKKLLVKYSDIIDEINKKCFELPSDMILKIDWLPFCLHNKILLKWYLIREVDYYYKVSKWILNVDLKLENKLKLNVCHWCSAYWKYCAWVFSEYVNLFGEKEFYTIK